MRRESRAAAHGRSQVARRPRARNRRRRRHATEAFAIERDWLQYHQPRNLVLALVGEARPPPAVRGGGADRTASGDRGCLLACGACQVGELAELFMWRGDAGAPPGLDATWTARDREHLGMAAPQRRACPRARAMER
jgi:hypothetical protein